jgi:hypothetical protein
MSLLDLVREFVAISGESTWGGESLPRAKELMLVLRKHGFTSVEIAELSDWRWADSVVRGYTSDWGGVSDLIEKKRVISELRKLVSSERKLGDVETFIHVDRLLKARGSSFEKVVDESVKAMERGDSFEGLSKLNEELDSNKTTVLLLLHHIDVEKKFESIGFLPIYREAVLDAIEKHGGYKKLLRWMELNRSSEVLESKIAQLNLEGYAQAAKTQEAANQYNMYYEYNIALMSIIASGWEMPALLIAPDVLKKFKNLKEVNVSLQDIKDAEDAERKSNERIQAAETKFKESVQIEENKINEKKKELANVTKEIFILKKNFEESYSDIISKQKDFEKIMLIMKSSKEIVSLVDLITVPEQVHLKEETMLTSLDLLFFAILTKVRKEDTSAEFKELVEEHIPPLREGIKRFLYLRSS